MFITPSFKKSLIVEQFQGNYLKLIACAPNFNLRSGVPSSFLFACLFIYLFVGLCVCLSLHPFKALHLFVLTKHSGLGSGGFHSSYRLVADNMELLYHQ